MPPLRLRSPLRLTLSMLCSLWLVLAWPAMADSPYDGHWQGQITLPTGELGIDVDFTSDASGAVSGDISIPVRKLEDVDLTEVEVHDDGLRFTIPGIPGNPRFDGALSGDGETLSGTFRQGAAQLDFALQRGADTVAAAQSALEGLDDVVVQALADFNVPGLVLAVVTDDQVVYADGFGYRDMENKLPMDADTLFAIGSTTKAMTTTVLAMQAEEDLLDWDEPVIRHLPGFDLEDSALAGRVTPRDLVTHRTGMPRHDLVWYNNTTLKRAQLVDRLPHLPLTADLRQTFQYNNLMYATAGYLSGRLEFTTWEAVMRRRLFGPLNMTRSNFSVETSQQDANHALPYRENEDDQLERIPFRNIDLVGPAGSVNSSVREMANWLRLNLAGGTFEGKTLIKESSLADLHTPHMTSGNAPPFEEAGISQIAYGMGWSIETYRGVRRIRHNGGIDGFITTVMFFPDHDLGIVAANNRGSGLSMLVGQLAADRVLDLEPIDWTGQALARQKEQEAATDADETEEVQALEGTQPSRSLEAYVGSYQHPGYGDLEVELVGGTLTWTFNGIATPLEHWHYDVWNGSEEAEDPTFEGRKVQFRGNVDGHIAEVVVVMEAAVDPIVFKKQADLELSQAAYLQRYVGSYQAVGAPQKAKIELDGNQLTVYLPGQPLYTLVPEVSGRFGIEGLSGFSVEFLETDGAVDGLAFHQPNGVFRFERLEE